MSVERAVHADRRCTNRLRTQENGDLTQCAPDGYSEIQTVESHYGPEENWRFPTLFHVPAKLAKAWCKNRPILVAFGPHGDVGHIDPDGSE